MNPTKTWMVALPMSPKRDEDRDLSDLAIGPADTGEALVPAALSLLLAL